MMTDVRLYGHLGVAFGKEHRFDIATVGEVVAALNANFPGFRQYLIQHSEPGYRVLVNDKPRTIEELALVVGVPSTIKIVPVVQGAADGKGIGMTILGVVLAVVGAVFQQWWLVGIGVSLTLGGVAQLIAPQPKVEDVAARETERKRVYNFSNTAPTITQGVPIPIRYGEQIVEGYPISVRLVIENDVG